MKHHLLATALAATLAAGSAQAVTYTGATGAGTVQSWTSGSLVAFDLDLATLGTTTLTFTVEAADVGSTLSFNSLVRNLSGLGLQGLSFSINGASFATPGSMGTDGFQAIAASGSSAQQVWARFSPALTTDFHLGDPLANGSGTDWTISLAGAQVGDQFTIAVAVPEPETYALMLAGIAIVGWAARRTRRNT